MNLYIELLPFHLALRSLECLVYDALRIAVSFTLNTGCPDRRRDVLSFVPVILLKFEGEDLEFNVIAKASRKFRGRKDLKSSLYPASCCDV